MDKRLISQRAIVILTLLTFPLSALALGEGIVEFALKSSVVSIVLAVLSLAVMLYFPLTRRTLVYPLILAGLVAAPLLSFFAGKPMVNSQLITAFATGYAAPWVFVAACIASASFAFLFKKNPNEEPSHPKLNIRESSFWWRFNFSLPLAITFSGYRWLSILIFMIPGLQRHLHSLGYLSLLATTILLNYFLAAALINMLLGRIGFYRRFNPGTFGAHILLISSIGEMIRLIVRTVLIVQFEGSPYLELCDGYFWPIRIVSLFGYLAILMSTYLPSHQSYVPNRT